MRSTIMRSAVGAAVGGATIGVAGLLAKSRSKPKRTGIRLPDELNLPRFDASKLTKGLDAKKLTKGLDAKKLASHVDVKSLAKNIDLKDLIRQVGDLAEQVEARSEEVHTLSGQAKRISRRIG
jgi:hypothetical protein